MIIEQMQEERLGLPASKEYFEAWMESRKEAMRQQPLSTQRTQETIKTIPVVVHVIHRGEALGTGTNIPFSQIQSQIEILTQDFRRTNPDAENTPDVFLDVAADSQIEFVLAKQDPLGLPTDGINRVFGPQNTYSPSEAELVGELALWPPEEYLNVWVLPMASPFIGYASFPISDLPGLNFAPSTRQTDGVTIDYRYFGTGGSAIGFSRGRTATHEIGHFLGLRHVWGDGGCSVDDFVEDTPLQSSPTNGCPSSPRVTCESRDMSENYMDYTDDVCMNIFTQGQVERMDVILASSPRRASLVNNRATVIPVLPDLDLAIASFLEPGTFNCEVSFAPSVIVYNAGNEDIINARLQIRLNSQIIETRDFDLSISTAERDTLSFSQISINSEENNSLEVEIILVNGRSDDESINNLLSINPEFQTAVGLPYAYEEGDIDQFWSVFNPDDLITWEARPLDISGNVQEVFWIQHYEYEQTGELDYLISPQFDLSELINPQLTFNLAHGPYDDPRFSDQLIIAVSTDCGNTFELFDTNYDKNRDFLQTSPPTLDAFVPSNESQFRREIFNLSDFAGLSNVRIAFITRNGFGNNIFIKDIEILEEEVYRYDLEIERLISPLPIYREINNGSQEEFEITNTGNLPLTGFVYQRSRNFQRPQGSSLIRVEAIPPGESQKVDLTITGTGYSGNLTNMTYIFTNPSFDQNPGNGDTLSVFFDRTEEEIEAIPWRQDFNRLVTLVPWVSINPENNDPSWELEILSSGQDGQRAVKLGNRKAGNAYWLASPTFDLSSTTKASVFFNYAAANVSENTSLKVIVSDDGGQSGEEVFQISGAELNTVSGSILDPLDLQSFDRAFVDLTEFAGSGKDRIYLNFVVEAGEDESDPIYIDNVELFLSANPEPVDPGLGNTTVYPNPARDFFNIVFNFRTFETVNIQIISASGAIVHDVNYPQTLNQTYTFSTALFNKGLFVIRISSNSLVETRKLIIH
ncbi:M43 family zinc metalloprotease [Pararhodonellum marinum]|uniref:M43 family zinc metalloprotease n=1 Tax=Pararhodonellum marinum TaxID=2755358 RepID=UPI001E3B321A|nr:M43 family zinc metalloprotease [Pararhodonellum marinum]